MSASQERQPTLDSIAPRSLARDMEQALAFYGQLGFVTTYHDEGFAIVERDRVALHFNVSDDEKPLNDHVLGWIGVTNIEALYQQYVPTGAIQSPLQAQPWGMKECVLCDPDRHLLIFQERIAMTSSQPGQPTLIVRHMTCPRSFCVEPSGQLPHSSLTQQHPASSPHQTPTELYHRDSPVQSWTEQDWMRRIRSISGEAPGNEHQASLLIDTGSSVHATDFYSHLMKNVYSRQPESLHNPLGSSSDLQAQDLSAGINAPIDNTAPPAISPNGNRESAIEQARDAIQAQGWILCLRTRRTREYVYAARRNGAKVEEKYLGALNDLSRVRAKAAQLPRGKGQRATK